MFPPGGQMFYIGLNRETEKLFLSETRKPRLLIVWCLASPSGPLPSFFKL